MPEAGEKYFGNYIAGTSWIYFNQNKTKRDSIYISEYQKHRKYDKLDDCIEWDRSEMKIRSNYLSSEEISCLYENPNCDRSYFVLQGLNFSVDIDSKKGIDTLFSTTYSSEIKKINFMRLPNTLTFNEVVSFHDKLWFAPDFGLIQYVSYNSIDTFYIEKFHKK